MNPTACSALSAEQPFPGLRPFAFADHPFFFGREDQSFEIYRRLDRSRFLAVIGSSGSGKSSLVRAGFRPLLTAESEDAGRAWRWIELRPGETPLRSLAAALAGLAPASDDPDADAGRRERFLFALRQSSYGLGEVLGTLGDTAGGALLLVVDQFEEVFRYTASGGAAKASPRDESIQFVQHLLQGTRDPTSPLHVLLTMRSDFIGDCGRFHGLPEAVSASQFLVPSLTRDQREEVIRGPIKKSGAAIEPTLVERILNDASDELDQLPVLQHCLQQLWAEAWRSRSGEIPHLTLDQYNRIGGIKHSLSIHADKIMRELPGLERDIEQIFRALSEIDREGRATRRPLRFSRLSAETGVSEATLSRVLDRFRADDCSFLLPSPASARLLGPLTVNPIDVTHEALLRRWERITTEAEGKGETPRGGWLWQEERDAHIYRALLALLEGGRTLPLDQVEIRWAWWNERPRTEAWAERYGGKIDRVRQLFRDSLDAVAAERERAAAAERTERERLIERELLIERAGRFDRERRVDSVPGPPFGTPRRIAIIALIALPALLGSIVACADLVLLTSVERMTVLAMIIVSTVLLGISATSGWPTAHFARRRLRVEFQRAANMLSQVPFLHDVGVSAIADIVKLLQTRRYKKGTTITRRGEPGDSMYFILDGKVEVQIRPQPVYLGPGEFFGEIALLTGMPRTADMIAAQPCVLLRLGVENFREVVGRHAKLARAIHAAAERRLEAVAPIT
jgi:CRP-like cAMP-binding protein